MAMEKLSKQDVLKSYGYAAIGSASLIFSTIIMALFINSFCPLDQFYVNCIGITGAFFDAIAIEHTQSLCRETVKFVFKN